MALDQKPLRALRNTNAPVPGQSAAIVAISRHGPYYARFPFGRAAMGDRAQAYAAAVRWRDQHKPDAAYVFIFTGRIELVWEAGVS